MAVQSLTNIRRQGQKTFKSSGIFTVPNNVHSVNVFLVAGGGGGSAANAGSGNSSAGGGGAGGQWLETSVAVTPGAQIPVIVGAGGKGGVYSSSNSNWGEPGTPGGDSQFAHVIAYGGSAGRGNLNDWSNLRHGTGGNLASTSSANHSAGGGGSAGVTAAEMHLVRITTTSNNPLSGGGATYVGQNFAADRGAYQPANMFGGAFGGDGATNAASWSSYNYPPYKTVGGFGGYTGRGYSGGGGGGFSRGTSYTATGNAMVGGFGFDGGGNGATWNSSSNLYIGAVAGLPNTGGGGGGGADNLTATNVTTRNGANGGSGLVIIKWVEEF